MRASALVILLILFALKAYADEWDCTNSKDDFCESYRTEHLANQADKKLNAVYKKLLSEYPDHKSKEVIEFTKVAQRAWLKYSDAHCAAMLHMFAGAPFTKAQEEHSCRLEQITKRIKELESYCETCSLPSPNPSFKRDALKRAP